MKRHIKKSSIKFKFKLTEEQKEAKRTILNNTLTMLSGSAGSSKTFVACQVALDRQFRNYYDRIVITRPTVSDEDIGYLPGDLNEKMEPWVQPIYDNMCRMHKKEEIDKRFESGEITISPVSFMRGKTFVDSFVIVDEAENITHKQMEMIVSRIGENSKMVICGDIRQIDLKDKRRSGFDFLYNNCDKVKDMSTFELKSNYRNPIVKELLKLYKNKDNEKI